MLRSATRPLFQYSNQPQSKRSHQNIFFSRGLRQTCLNAFPEMFNYVLSDGRDGEGWGAARRHLVPGNLLRRQRAIRNTMGVKSCRLT